MIYNVKQIREFLNNSKINENAIVTFWETPDMEYEIKSVGIFNNKEIMIVISLTEESKGD